VQSAAIIRLSGLDVTVIRSAAADLSHAHQLKALCVKTIGASTSEIYCAAALYVFSSASAAALSHPHSPVAREIYSIWLNQFASAALDCAPHTHKRGGRRKLWEKSQPPRLSQSFAYMLLRGGATYYVTEPNDGAICQHIDTGFYSCAFIDFFVENCSYQRKTEVKFY
jgi:hypothetical protein